MTKRSSVCSGLFSIAAIIVLITDPKTAFYGASQGLELCLKTVIPSLMPFFVLSVMLTSSLSGKTISILKPLRRVCGIPEGAEGLFLLGLLGGYPVGAQAVAQSWETGSLSNTQARRMLGFFSNCGPSFLFGITSSLFSSNHIPWVLWGIHVSSAVLTGIFLPCKEAESVKLTPKSHIRISEAVRKGIQIMANVCAWILLSRCFIAYLDKWFLRSLPHTFRLWIIGLLELTNGCVSLSEIPSEAERFLMISGFLALGGFCVGMQTISVTGSLGTGWYFPGKLLQFAFSLTLSAMIAPILYPNTPFHPEMIVLLIFCGGFIRIKKKKEVAFSKNLVYNNS